MSDIAVTAQGPFGRAEWKLPAILPQVFEERLEGGLRDQVAASMASYFTILAGVVGSRSPEDLLVIVREHITKLDEKVSARDKSKPN